MKIPVQITSARSEEKKMISAPTQWSPVVMQGQALQFTDPHQHQNATTNSNPGELFRKGVTEKVAQISGHREYAYISYQSKDHVEDSAYSYCDPNETM